MNNAAGRRSRGAPGHLRGRSPALLVCSAVAAIAVTASGCTVSHHDGSRGSVSSAAPTAVTTSTPADGGGTAAATPGSSSSGSSSSGVTGGQPPTPAQLPRIDPATLATFYSQKISW